MSTKSVMIANYKYMGKEPEYDDKEIIDTDLIKHLNWYSYMKDKDDSKRYIEEHCSRKNIIIDINKHYDNTYGWLARIVDKGGVLSVKDTNKLINYISNLKPDESTNTPITYISSNKTKKLLSFLDPFEEAVDNFVMGFDSYKCYSENQIPQQYVKQIIDFYIPQYNEVKKAYNKEDDQLVEAYSIYSKRELETLINLLNNIIEDGERFLGNVKKERKPRKKKNKSIDVILKHFKYKQFDNDLKITSDAPSKILGSSAVYTLNTKNNMLTMFISNEDGLSISRTSIVNYNESLSKSKRVGRKINDIINSIITGTKRSRLKVLDGVNSTESKFVDRLNEHTIILKIDK